MFRLLVLLCVFLVPSCEQLYAGSVQWTGWWNGRYGTWTFSAPVCDEPGCDMCNEIRALLAEQSRQNRIKYQRGSALQGSAQQDESRWEYRREAYVATETRTRLVKVCDGWTCYWVNQPYTVQVTRYRTVAYPVVRKRSAPREPKGEDASHPSLPKEILDTKSLASLKSTPLFVVDSILEELNPARGEKVFDPGCGDGRFLMRAAASYEAEAVGIELDPLLVATARERALSAGLGSLVHVFEGDVRDYDLAEADYAVLYLYGDLMADVVQRLPAGCRIASFLHPIPGVESKRHSVLHAGREYVYYTGEK